MNIKSLLVSVLLSSNVAFALEGTMTLSGVGAQTPMNLWAGIIETGPRTFHATDCDCDITVPEAEWRYDINGLINVTVSEEAGSLPVDGQVINLSLDGEKLTLKSSPHPDLVLVAILDVKEGTPVKTIKTNQYNVLIAGISKKALQDSITIKNVAYANGILTYETGPEALLSPDHRIQVQEKGGSIFATVLTWFNVSVHSSRRTSIAIPGGLRHTVELAKNLQKFRNKKVEIELSLELRNFESDKGSDVIYLNLDKGVLKNTTSVTGK